MALDLSSILNAMGIIADDHLKKAGYDKTVVCSVVSCDDPEKGIYTVLHQNARYKNVYSYGQNKIYEPNSLVYVTIPSNSYSLRKYIIGEVSEDIVKSVKVSTGLDNYTSVGGIDISYSGAMPIIAPLSDGPILLYAQSAGGASPERERLRAAFMVSPYFIFEYDIQNSIAKGYESKGNFGFEIQLVFDAGTAEGGTYTKTYTIDVNRMTGQPYLYANNTHQYAIFKVEKPELFSYIQDIHFFAENFDDGDSFTISNMKFYAATKQGEELGQYELKIAAVPSCIELGSGSAEAAVSASLTIGGLEFKSSDVKYYWFTENLLINEKAGAQGGYSRYGGEGWKCLNQIEDIESLDAVVFYDYIPGKKTINLNVNNAPLYHNKIKCIAIYYDKIIESNVIDVVNYASNYKYDISLTSKIRNYTSSLAIEDWDAGTALQMNDYAGIICSVSGTAIGSTISYIWQTIDSNNILTWIRNNNNTQYIDGYAIYEYIIFKCGIVLDGVYIGANEIRLTNIDNEMRMRLLTKNNIFNSLTNNGQYQGIFYVDPNDLYVDPNADKKVVKKIDPKNITDANAGDYQLYINAEYIRSGRLEVADGDKTIFYADLDDYRVLIGGFTVTDKELYINKAHLEAEDVSGVYLGTDGISVSGTKGLFSVNKDGLLKADNAIIHGAIYATAGEIGGFTLVDNILSIGTDASKSYFGINTKPKAESNDGIWLGGTGGFNNAVFSVNKDGELKATKATITGNITANSLTIVANKETKTFDEWLNDIGQDIEKAVAAAPTIITYNQDPTKTPPSGEFPIGSLCIVQSTDSDINNNIYQYVNKKWVLISQNDQFFVGKLNAAFDSLGTSLTTKESKVKQDIKYVYQKYGYTVDDNHNNIINYNDNQGQDKRKEKFNEDIHYENNIAWIYLYKETTVTNINQAYKFSYNDETQTFSKDEDGKPTETTYTVLEDGDFIYTDLGYGTDSEKGDQSFFKVSKDGLVQANNAIIYGTIYARAGEIGGFTLKDNILSASFTFKPSTLDPKEETFLFSINTNISYNERDDSKYAILIKANNEYLFSVTKSGDLYGKSVEIDTCVFNTKIYSKSNQFNIDADGSITIMTQTVDSGAAGSKDYLIEIPSAGGENLYNIQTNRGRIYFVRADNILKQTSMNSDIRMRIEDGMIYSCIPATDSQSSGLYLNFNYSKDINKTHSALPTKNDNYYSNYCLWAGNSVIQNANFRITQNGNLEIYNLFMTRSIPSSSLSNERALFTALPANDDESTKFFSWWGGDTCNFFQNPLYLAILKGEPKTGAVGADRFYTKALYVKGSNIVTGHIYDTWESSSAISVTSDANLKHDILDLDDKYSILFDNLIPRKFKYNDGTSDRFHTGFIAQELETAISTAGLTSQDVAALIKDENSEYSIRYGELIALCVKEIQKLKAEVTTLKSKICLDEKFSV